MAGGEAGVADPATRSTAEAWARHWVERLQARAAEARALVGERIYRTWLLYLTCSAVAFEQGSIGLYQVLLRKHGDRTGGRAPRTREDLYALDR
jgi:cyclopropane-fatty-acyl-phospholipid synthase